MKNKIEILNYLKENNQSGYKTRESTIKKEDNILYNEIISYSNIYFKDHETKFIHKLYVYLLDIKDFPRCKKCGKILKFKNRLDDGYSIYCSRKCSSSSDEMKEKTKLTNIERYGVEHNSQIKEVRKKKSENSIFKTKKFKEDLKNKMIDKHGVESFSKTKEWYDRVSKTSSDKFGVEWVSKAKNVIEKMKKTNIERYGVESFSQTEDHKQKMSEIYKEKIKENYDKYNVIGFSENNVIIDNTEICGHVFEIDRWNLYARENIYKYENVCIECNPYNGNSNSIHQTEIFEYIKNIGFNPVMNYRDKFEIDIYIPEMNLGIEFNGLYWHSDLKKDKNYHTNKYNFFKNKNIDIINIFEDEWINKKEIIKSIIDNRLNVNTKTIHARKCIIKNLENKEYKKFLEENHIQGHINSKYKYGLFYNDELVSVMSFGTYRKIMGRDDKDNHFELLRFCNKLNCNVVGGANRLFKHFTKNNIFEKIITYSDLRYFNGKIYPILGFTFVKVTVPNYWYVKGIKRYHRFKFRKSELVKMGYDKNKTEKEIMEELKYFRIYDCGSGYYEYHQ